MIYLIRLFLKNNTIRTITNSIIAFLLSCGLVTASTYIDSDIRIDCTQIQTLRLDCQYTYHNNPPDIQVYYQNESVTISAQQDYPWPEAKSNILFLIDTSDPARGKAIKAKIEHVKALVQHRQQHQYIGLATFDKGFTLLSDFQRSTAVLLSRLDTVSAKGKTTELYRNLLEAIQLFSKSDADRKIIYVFSDGLAEDKAYYHSDVVNAALRNNVIIHSLGYPRSVSRSVALQVLRRLSEESGGRFYEASSDFNIPDKTLANILNNNDRGGDISLSLSSLQAVPGRKTEFEFLMSSQDKEYIVYIPVNLPLPLKKDKTDNEAINLSTTKTTPPPQVVKPVIRQQTPPKTLDLWLWYGVPIALLILIILTLITIYLLFKRQPVTTTKLVVPETAKAFAYLIEQDEYRKQYPITKTIWRIGRSQDNETTLDDNSISRIHAEIRRDSDGQFILLDMNSTNGLFVNDKQVKKHYLREGDIIEIGDVYLRFTQLNPEHIQLDKTSIQRTKNPIM